MDPLALGARLPREPRGLPRGASRPPRPAGRCPARTQTCLTGACVWRSPVIACGLPGLQRKPRQLHAPPAVPASHAAPCRVAREEPAALERREPAARGVRARPQRRLAGPFWYGAARAAGFFRLQAGRASVLPAAAAQPGISVVIHPETEESFWTLSSRALRAISLASPRRSSSSTMGLKTARPNG